MEKSKIGMSLRSSKRINENFVQVVGKTHKKLNKNVLKENNSTENNIKNSDIEQQITSIMNKKPQVVLSQEEQMFLTDVTIIKNTLGIHFFNINDRLKMDYVPYCIKSYDQCYKKHLSDTVGPTVTHDFRKNLLLYEDYKFGLFLLSIEQMIYENIFPDDILLMIILLILNLGTTDKNHKFYLTQFALIFEKILDAFPLCWANLNQQYYTILFKRNSNVKCFTDDYSDEYGIFGIILSILDELITIDDVNNNCNKSANNNDINDSEIINSSFDDFINVADYHKFSSLTKDEKLNRIFTTLHLLIKILENDLSIWLFNYEKSFVNNCKLKMPLITVFLNKYINNYLNLLRIYGKCVQNLSQEKINVFSRLINLLANNALINEIQSTTYIKYPNINNFGEDFVRDLLKVIDSYNNNFDLIIKFINNISTPYAKMLLLDKYLDRLRNNTQNEKISLQKIYNVFLNKEWLNFPNFNIKMKFQQPDDNISRFNFIQMFKELFVIYCNVYQLNNIIKEFIKKDKDRDNYKLDLDNKLVCCHLDLDYRRIVKYKNDIFYYYKLKNLIYNNQLQYFELFDEFSQIIIDLIKIM